LLTLSLVVQIVVAAGNSRQLLIDPFIVSVEEKTMRAAKKNATPRVSNGTAARVVGQGVGKVVK
jgi:hypothetical protein